jgi:DNA polymerase delta subunit 2
MHTANKKWGKKRINDKLVVKKDKVLDIKTDEPCWVIGTVYCEMKYKPNVLDDVVNGGMPQLSSAVESYSDLDLDEILLEDESGRVQLEGDILKDVMLVTGVIVGLLGMESKPGVFKVVDIVYPFISAQKADRSSNTKVAFVSGLEFDGTESVKYDLLSDYLTGQLGASTSDISRLVIAGNSTVVSKVEEDSEADKKVDYGAKHKSNYNVKAVQQLDYFLKDLLESIPVDIMPGESDPAETSLPQQPLHKAFFQHSKPYINTSILRTQTNPNWFQIDELRLLGTSGENINDIYKYIVPDHIKDARIEMLEATLNWQNIIPTAPDTLWCYPYPDKDPFTLTETPHVYFVGNQPQYEEKLVTFDRDVKVKLITIPKFSETGQIVILDTKTLETEVITIDA